MKGVNMELDYAWPTAIGKGKFDSLELSQYLLMNYDLSNPKSEADGYNIFEDGTSYISNFKEVALKAFNDYLQKTIRKNISDYGGYELKGWITGHGAPYNMSLHNHFGAHLSAVFYVLSEDKTGGGEIVFTDPRFNANRGYDMWFKDMFRDKVILPETGDYLIFPSFLYHYVLPYYSSLRIAVPVDLYLYRD